MTKVHESCTDLGQPFPGFARGALRHHLQSVKATRVSLDAPSVSRERERGEKEKNDPYSTAVRLRLG